MRNGRKKVLDEEPPNGEVVLETLLEGVLRQLSGIVELSEDLEKTLAASLCSCQEISSEAIRTLQGADFIRQSVRDIHAILAEISPNVSWRLGQGITLKDLRLAVDMQGSISQPNADHDQPDHAVESDIWL